MFVIDTNIVSELMHLTPNKNVIVWFNAQEARDLFLPIISLAEIVYGINVLPEGNKKNQLRVNFENFLKLVFEGRLLNFDEPTARSYGDIMTYKKKLGRPMDISDAQIAAITKVHNFTLVTRNTRDFENCGIKILNPFETKA